MNFNPEQLQHGLQALKLSLPPATQDKLWQYLALLQKWNRAYNLTAITEPSAMVTKHLLDSLAVWPYLQGQRIADVGTGAGLPGIPLALAFPEKQLTLIDSNGKKIRFLTQVKLELELTHVEAVHARAQDYRPDALFDAIITRALGELNVIIASTRHLVKKGGRIWAMKGRCHAQELAAVREKLNVFPLNVPGLDEERHLIEIEL